MPREDAPCDAVARGVFASEDLRGGIFPSGGNIADETCSKGGIDVDALRATALTLIIIGAVNWGLIALFNFDLVTAVFGGESQFAPSLASRVVYALVALSGLYALTFYRMGSEEESRQRVRQDEP